jgi:hypothetical protein
MPETLRQSHEAATGDLIAYTIGTSDDVDIASGENFDTAAAPKRAYAILNGEQVTLTGRLVASGADASLDFTLPADLRPKVDELLQVHVSDGGVNKVGILTIVASTGVAAIVMSDAAAFAAADYVTLSGSYLRA